MKLKSRILSLLLSGALAFTTAGVGAIAAPGGNALAAADARLTSAWNLKVVTSAGSDHVIKLISGNKEDNTDRTLGGEGGSGNVWVDRGGYVTLNASHAGITPTAGYTLAYKWSFTGTNAGNIFIDGAASGVAYGSSVKVGVPSNATALTHTVTMECEVVEKKDAIENTILTTNYTVHAGSFVVGQYPIVLDKDATLGTYADEEDGSYDWYVSDTTQTAFSAGTVASTGAATAIPDANAMQDGSYIKWESGSGAAFTVNADTQGYQALLVPKKGVSDTLKATLYTADDGIEAHAKAVTGATSTLTVNVDLNATGCDIYDSINDNLNQATISIPKGKTATIEGRVKTNSNLQYQTSLFTLKQNVKWVVGGTDAEKFANLFTVSAGYDSTNKTIDATSFTLTPKGNYTGDATHEITITGYAKNSATYVEDANGIPTAGPATAAVKLQATGNNDELLLKEGTSVKATKDQVTLAEAYINNAGYTTGAAAGASVVHYTAEIDDESIISLVIDDKDTTSGFAPVGLKIKGLKDGSTDITLTGTMAGAVFTLVIPVTVGAETPATSATMTPAKTTIAAAGGDLALTAKAGSDMATDGTWTFSASPSDAATLSGAATDKGVGTVTLKAAENKTEKDVEITVTGVYTAKDGKTKLATVTATVTVSAKAKEEEKVPTVVLSTGAAASMTAGSTISGHVTGTNLTGKVITYTSSDTSIVTVTATNTSGTSYNVVAKKAGTAYIYAYIDNKLYASTAVTVTGTTPSPEPTPSPETIDHDITDFIYDGGVYDIDHNTMEATYTDSVGAGKVEIPRYIYLVSNGKTYMVPVTGIAAKAFKKSDVKKVIVPDTVDTIGKAAFRYCRRLEKVAFEDASNIIYIGKNAFANTKDGLVIKQKHGYKFDSDIREDLEKYSNLVIK